MEKQKQQKKEYFWVVNLVGLLFMFGFGLLVKPFGPITDVGIKVLGVFIGVIVMSVFSTQLFYVAILGMGALVYHGYLTPAGACAAFLGSTTVTQLIFVTAISGLLRASGAMKVVAKKMLDNSLMKGRPLLIIIVFFVTTYLVSIIATFAPSCILMFSLFDSIREESGYEANDPFCKQMLLGIYIASMGSYALPFTGIQMTSIAMVRQSLEPYGLALTDGTYFITNVVIFLAFLLIYSLMIPTVFRCNLAPLKNFDIGTSTALQDVSGHFNKQQLIPIAAFLTCVAYSLLSNIVPKTFGGYKIIFGFSGPWIWMVMVAVLSIIKVDGQRFINGPETLKNHTMWNLVCLVGMFSILGGTMTNEDIGIRQWLISLIGPLFSNAGLPMMIVMVVIIVTLATQLLNGLPCVLATIAVVMPFTAEIALQTGINAGVMGTLINCCANLAFLTYSGSVFASLLLSREEIDQKFIWSKGVLTLTVFLAVTMVLGIGLSYIL